MYKELAAYLIVYNKIRRAMLDAASGQQVDLSRISLVDVMRFLAAKMTGLLGVEDHRQSDAPGEARAPRATQKTKGFSMDDSNQRAA